VRLFAHKYGFTEAETRAIVFITVAAVTGACYGWFADEPARADFREEYKRMDSIFAVQALSPVNDAGYNSEKVSAGYHVVSNRSAKVDINSAGVNALQSIPGIGPSTAEKIVAYRKEHGPFRELVDLMKVNSIGSKKFEQWKTYICISE
jgi:competence ComEA-like helix-hairpin-helix protein